MWFFLDFFSQQADKRGGPGGQGNQGNQGNQGGQGGQGGSNNVDRNNVDRNNIDRNSERNNDRNNVRNDRNRSAGRPGNNNIGGGDRGGDRGDQRGGGGDRDRKGGFDRTRRSDEFLIAQRLKSMQGPQIEVAAIEEQELKFSGRNRLYVGNLPNDINEPELIELFKPYGEIAETFLNTEKNFAFLKVDYRANAERAKRELDGSVRKNRSLRVRFAPNATTLKVRNMTSFVSNELLYKAFEIFGNVSRYAFM